MGKLEKVRAISKDRLTKRVGFLAAAKMRAIGVALRIALDL